MGRDILGLAKVWGGPILLFVVHEVLGQMIPVAQWIDYAVYIVIALWFTGPISKWCQNRDGLLKRLSQSYLMVGVLGVSVCLFIIGESKILTECPPVQVSRDVINNNIGRLMDSGRREAIECLARAGEDLSRIDIDDAHIGALDLPPHTRLEDARMAGTNLKGAKFPEAYLASSKMSGATLDNADLSNAILSGAILGEHLLFDDDREQKGRRVCYMGASVTNADFEGTHLTGVYLVGVRGLECSQLREALDWETAIRTEEHRCGAEGSLPPLPDYVRPWGGTHEGCIAWLREHPDGAR